MIIILIEAEAETHCRKINVPRYKYFGRFSKFLNYVNCSNIKKEDLFDGFLKGTLKVTCILS